MHQGKIAAARLILGARLLRVSLALAAFFLTGQSLLFSRSPEEPQQESAQSRDPERAEYLKWGGSYRLRGETQRAHSFRGHGAGREENYLLSRLRLDLQFRANEQWSFRAEIQDARSIGGSFSDADFLGRNHPYRDAADINKAYLHFQPKPSFQLLLGRQSISLGDRRVFGPGDWGNTGRYAWDAAFLQGRLGKVESKWLFGRPIIHAPDRWPNRTAAGPTAFSSYNTVTLQPFDLDLFYVAKLDGREMRGEAGNGGLSSHNLGFQLTGRQGNVNYGSTVVVETGSRGGDPIRAYGYTLLVGHAWDAAWKPRLEAQHVVASGDEDPGDGRCGTFGGLFSGADTVLYGWMNLFFWRNLRESRLDLIFSPVKKVEVRAEYHHFALHRKADAWYSPGGVMRRDSSGQSGGALGHELDVTVKRQFGPRAAILAGYSLFFPSEFVKRTGDGETARWVFLELTLAF
jgi:hypothetical protein